jgi:hypothetical protein
MTPDKGILTFKMNLTPAHCRAARGWLDWTQAELSRRSGVGLSAIRDFEKGSRRTHKSILLRLQETFALEGIWCSEGGIYDEGEAVNTVGRTR